MKVGVPFDHFEKQCQAMPRIEELRREAFANGCGYWLGEANKPNCCFPRCMACYPFWQPRYRHLWGVDEP